MPDREKVIEGLECCTGNCGYMTDCPYSYDCHGADPNGVSHQLLTDALALLKEQEPRKKGYWKYPQSLDCCCSECSNQPDHEPGESVPLYDYCPYCGKAVKWDDRD